VGNFNKLLLIANRAKGTLIVHRLNELRPNNNMTKMQIAIPLKKIITGSTSFGVMRKMPPHPD